MIETYNFMSSDFQWEAPKELMLLSVISQSLFQPFSLEDNLLVILTALTSGSGVGFNRAMLFLREGDRLQGEMWLGPRSSEEAGFIWEVLSTPGIGYVEIIEHNRALVSKNQDTLSRRIKNLAYLLDEENSRLIPAFAACNKDIYLVRDARSDPRVEEKFMELIQVDEFLCIPLLAREKVLGEIVVDNAITRIPIGTTDIKLAGLCGLIAGNIIYTTMLHQKLLETEKMAAMGELAMFVTHQLRTPLVTIGGFTGQLLRPDVSEERKTRNLQIIRDEVQRLEGIVYQMGHFLKVSMKEPVFFDAGPVIHSVLRGPEIQVRERGYTMDVKIEDDAPQVFCDPTSFGEVFRNLLDNAFDATPPGGEIIVRGFRKDKDRYILSVRDTGCGISNADRKRLFQPFFTTKGKGDGSRTSVHQEGLGLVRCQDRSPEQAGKGSPLQIDFSMSRKGIRTMKRILLVEDEKTLCLLYEEELGKEGYAVKAVYDADAALEELGRNEYDLIITDIRMPGKNGIELITQIMGLRKDIPIIINSAYQSYKDDFMTWAADAYVVKSASLDELKRKVKELIGE